ncbi:MAG: thioesterase family protein [Pseudomonadales bacterium]
MSEPTRDFDCPILCPAQCVEQAWIDYNGHMNMAFYNLLFDRALDHVYDLLGIGESYVRAGGGSCFTLEAHVNYLQELVLDDPVRVTFQLLDSDPKRLHFFEHMYHAEQGYLAATSEQLALHVDMASRRAGPFPDDVMQRVDRLMALHEPLPRPEQAGRAMGIRRRS